LADPAGGNIVEIAAHIAVIGREGELLAEAAGQSGLDAAIDTCPGWVMRDLVRHLSEIHLWAAAHVARSATKMWVDDLTELTASWPDLAVFWPDDGDLVDYYLQTNRNLVRELESAPSDVEAMTFLPAPSPLAMWARRQAHETSIHRFDAQHAAGTTSEFDPTLASDGIDELLTAFAPRADAFPIDTTKTMVVHATDTDDRWRLTLGPAGIDAVRGDGTADLRLTGRATDLYLTVWNRGADSAIEVAGDRDLLETWHSNHRIRWS
jgi:uncharacterized protein (TIGR03083 family)